MSSIRKKCIPFLVLTFCLSLCVFPRALAFDNDLVKNFVTITFTDNGPVIVPINVRYSLWRMGDPEANEIDVEGNIVVSDENYGGWQIVKTLTPAANGTSGIDLLNKTVFPDFPEIFDTNAFLQVEFKYTGEPNTAYRIVDMLRDSPDYIKRLLIVNDLSSLNPVMIQGGTPNNDFSLDINFNATQFVKLIFGGDGKALAYDLISNWFNLDSRLNINGFPGIKLAINANAADSETQLLSVRNSAGTTVFSVDEDGDIISTGVPVTRGNANANVIDSGTTAALSGGTVTTSFASTFTTAPKVVITPNVTAQYDSGFIWPYISATTTTGFTITSGVQYDGKTFNWIAVGK